MKTLKLIMAIFFITGSSILTQGSKPASPDNHYMVIASHTPEQCMNHMTEVKAKGDAYLSKFYFGCMSGDHTAYAIMDAASEEAVKKMLPKGMQETAKIIKVDKFTVAQIEGLHKKK